MMEHNANGGGAKPPVNIAIYTRKSNDENLNGTVTSLESQKSCCRSYIEIQREKGWQEYPESFDDPALSGKNLERPSMRRLLKAVEEGKVNGVIVYKLDRLTRSSKDFHHLLELFEKHSVAFVSATESIDTKSPQGRLMTAIMVQFAQYDRELDQERSKDFHLARAGKGLWCGGLPPLGYDSKDKLLVVNEKEADLVRRIFDLYLRHESTIKVALELNRMGFRGKLYQTITGRPFGGKRFDDDQVIRVLRRKIYIGFVTNSRTGKEFPGQQKAIIDPKTFEQAQKILDEHARSEGHVIYMRNKHNFRLKGLVRCAECGSAVTGYTRPKGKVTYRYYRCMANKSGLFTPCVFKCIQAAKLEEFVVEKIAAVGWDQALITQAVKKVQDLTKGGVKGLEKERRGVSERLKTTRREIENLVGMVKGQGVSVEASEELARLENVKRELEAKSGELEAAISHRTTAVYDVDAIAGALQRFARFIYQLPIEMQIQAIHLLVKQVLVGKSGILVTLHELPIADLDEALNVNGGGAPKKFNPRRLTARRGLDTTVRLDHSETDERTPVVELEQNWRGQEGGDTAAITQPPVPELEKTHLIPPIPISLPCDWARIANGERVIRENPPEVDAT
ncbi:MAG TPA: hypothetical protein DCZ01_06575 [Elusimicrobia bacterium]|nr:hypothetical protein [Elusimicrobiota bacterium]